MSIAETFEVALVWLFVSSPLWSMQIVTPLSKAVIFNITYVTNPRHNSGAIPQAVIALCLIWIPTALVLYSTGVLDYWYPRVFNGMIDPSNLPEFAPTYDTSNGIRLSGGTLLPGVLGFTMTNTGWTFLMLWPGLMMTNQLFSLWASQHGVPWEVEPYVRHLPSWAILTAVAFFQTNRALEHDSKTGLLLAFIYCLVLAQFTAYQKGACFASLLFSLAVWYLATHPPEGDLPLHVRITGQLPFITPFAVFVPLLVIQHMLDYSPMMRAKLTICGPGRTTDETDEDAEKE